MNIQIENKVKKTMFNPLNPNNFVVLFENYFANINLSNAQVLRYYFNNKKISDFNYSDLKDGEFIISGNFDNQSYSYTGFLNCCRF